MEKDTPEPDQAEEHPTEAEIDETLKETFPASDPPGWTLGLKQQDAPTDRPEIKLKQTGRENPR